MDLKTNLDEHDFLLKKEPVFMLRNQINLKIFMAPIPIYGSLQQFSFFFLPLFLFGLDTITLFLGFRRLSFICQPQRRSATYHL